MIKLHTDEQLAEIEERITTLQRLIILDIQTLMNEIKEYRRFIASAKDERRSEKQTVNEKLRELPPLLTPKDISGIMGISKDHA